MALKQFISLEENKFNSVYISGWEGILAHEGELRDVQNLQEFSIQFPSCQLFSLPPFPALLSLLPKRSLLPLSL